MKQISSLILLAASALLASCTQDEFKDGIVPPGNSLYVSSAVVGTGNHTETEAATRADVGDVPVTVTKGSLGIFRSQGTGYSSTLDNVKYTYKGADQGWQAATAADTLFLNGGDVDVCAYYPYNGDATYSDKTIILLTSGKYTGTADVHDPNDICYDTDRTLNGSRRATTFELKHALAMLEFKITKDADYKGDCRVTSVSVLNPELILSSDIDITNGTYGTTPVKRSLTYNPGPDADGILIGNTPLTTAALLVPFTPTSDGLTLTFTVNEMPVEANIEETRIAKVEAGRRYVVNLILKATSMQVTGVDMLPWEETGVGGDDYTWYPVEDVIKLTDPVHIASYDWAWSNLEKGDAGYTLGSFQTLPGSLWAWNVLEPMTPPVVAGNEPVPNKTGTYQYAQDPCSLLSPAGTWSLPTQHQIDLLMSTDHVNTAGGCWFGTSTAIAGNKDDGTYLFLPANNLLLYHGWVSDVWLTALNEGVSGYWMAISDLKPQVQMLTVGGHEHLSLSGLPAVGTPFVNTAIYGASVRCVQKARETIILDDVEWAMGNLVKKTDGTYVIDDHQAAMPVFTGSSTATWTDVNRGYHYTWNSLDRNTMGEKEEYDYDSANDPCAKVVPAGTWRTPTKEDFEKAMAKGNVKGSYALNGVTVEGYYLGTNTTPAKGGGDEYLFLPMAGGGDQSSYYDFYSQYWTSTEKEGSEGGSEAYAFNGSKFGTTGDMSVRSKSHPLAIRCVKGSLEKVYTLTKSAEVKIGTTTYARTNLNHDFTFEAEPWISGKMNGTDIDYWFWGRKEINTSGVYTNNVADWSVLTGDEEDPCKSVSGGAWVLPTSSQLTALSKKVLPAGSKVKINGEVLTVTGDNGFVKNASETTGGAVFYDSTTKNVLFLPAAGTEDTVGGINNPVLKGGYQSSNAMAGGTGCMPLSISQNTIGVSVPGWAYRYTGNSIRCVKK